MKRLIEICFVFCCLGFIYTCAKTDNFAEIRLFGQEKSISEELETIIEDNQLENFLFYDGEKAICIYEGGIAFEINAYKFAVYKETVEKDILFENMLFIERDTGDIYTWGGEELEKLTLIDSFNVDEFEEADLSEEDNSIDRVYEWDEIELLMDKIMDLLAQEGSWELKIVYDGTIDLINKKYFGVSLMEDFEDHIIRDQHYYLEVESGNLYAGGEDTLSLRTELYYIGNIKE